MLQPIKGLVKSLPISLLFLLLFSGFVQAQSVIDKIVKRGTIKVGMSVFKPWAFRAKNGEYIGFEIDVAKALAKDLGVKLQLVPTAWDGIIPALQTGKMDVIIAGMSVTTKRNLKINFSIPYGGQEYVVLANKKYSKKYGSISSFNSRRVTIAVRRGSIPALLAKNFFPKAKIRQFDDDSISSQEVANGKAHLTVDTTVAAIDRLKSYPQKLYLVEDGKVISTTPSAFALRKGDFDALNLFNNWITLKTQSGWLKNKSDYWFKSNKWADQ